MMPQRMIGAAALIGAVALLLILTLQYPLSTTFPMGGDAAFYVRTARTLLSDTPIVEKIVSLKNAPYPLAYLATVGSGALPLDWPSRFTWLVTITYIAVGACLGLLLYRLQNIAAAATGIALWALVPIDITTHIEAGTFAQLLSLAALALFFERLLALSRIGILITYCAVILSHPLTGLVLFLTILTATAGSIPLWRTLSAHQRQIYVLLLSLATLSLAATLYKFGVSPSLLTSAFTTEADNFSLPELIRSVLGPFLMLAPLGFVRLLAQPKENELFKIILMVFCIFTVLLSFNHLLGAGLLTFRFKSYFVFGTILLSALALPWIVRKFFSTTLLRIIFVAVLFASLAAITWHNNNRVYRYYEGSGNYARLHPAELAGMVWMKDNLAPDSVIITSNINRHVEWVPALTGLQWLSVPNVNDEAKINDTLHEARVYGRPVYLALFLNAEGIPKVFPSAQVEFATKHFRIIRLR